MALKSPLMPSPTGALNSSFSPYSESPNSPQPYTPNFGLPQGSSNRNSGPSDSLAPPPSPYPQQIEPSPVDSNGTESTEIDDDAQDENIKSPSVNGDIQSPDIEITSPQGARSPASDRIRKINTQLPLRPRADSADDAPQSVIHAPSGYQTFEDGKSNEPSPTHPGGLAVASPVTPEAALSPHDKKLAGISPVNTDFPATVDRATPRAQTRQELEDEWKRKSRRTSSLEDIPEAMDKDDADAHGDAPATNGADKDGPDTAGLVGDGTMSQAMRDNLTQAEEEVTALRTALTECWTLCNTLAGLSSGYRQRTFKFSGKQEVQEKAWRSCWRLCQQLYDNRDAEHSSQVVPTLELCRDFCQSLFDARQKGDANADAILRVSFELNTHLYNTHDRALPDAFNERTLEFYITMCHRLMKQRTSLPQETDALLRACWALAENLFTLRQSSHDGKSTDDEELLSSAVQSCWELCDLFREGWTQHTRPERSTPRPSQTTFASSSTQSQTHSHSASSFQASTSSRSEGRSNSSLSERQYHDAHTAPPETPTTIFDDTASSASSPDEVAVPNILVLGPAGGSVRGSAGGGTHHDRWSSNASVLSGYSESASSQRTSSTATASGSEDSHLMRLRYLLLKAGMNTGYAKPSSPTGQSLPAYVQTLAPTAFGPQPWQRTVLSSYSKLVTHDPSLSNVHTLASRRLGAQEVAKSIKWLSGGSGGRNAAAEQWAWMRDLYRLVMGFGVEEAARRGGGFAV